VEVNDAELKEMEAQIADLTQKLKASVDAQRRLDSGLHASPFFFILFIICYLQAQLAEIMKAVIIFCYFIIVSICLLCVIITSDVDQIVMKSYMSYRKL